MVALVEVLSVDDDSHPTSIIKKTEGYLHERPEIDIFVGNLAEKLASRDDESMGSFNLNDPRTPHAIGERFESDKSNNWAGPVFFEVDPSKLCPLDTTEIMVNYQKEGLLRIQGTKYPGSSELDSCFNNSLSDCSYHQTPSLPSVNNDLSAWKCFDLSGKRQYKNRNYKQALADYRAALGFNCPSLDRQILLSNVVSCRLKIGGTAMIEAAIVDAKKCIEINDKWSKGHIHLASAYIALGGNYDNVFNSLQRALAIDPSNEEARQLLHKLRRNDCEANSSKTPSGEDQSFEEFHPHPCVESHYSNENSSNNPDANSMISINNNVHDSNRSSSFISVVTLSASLRGLRVSQRLLHKVRCPPKKNRAYERL